MGLVLLSVIITLFLMVLGVFFWWYYLGDIRGWNWVATFQSGLFMGIISGLLLGVGMYYLAKILQ